VPAKERDWSKTGTIGGYAEYVRSHADALLVIVVRPNDAVLAADPRLASKDVIEAVELRLPGLVADLERARAEKKPARLKWEDIC
jgi:hypothetical protein